MVGLEFQGTPSNGPSAPVPVLRFVSLDVVFAIAVAILFSFPWSIKIWEERDGRVGERPIVLVAALRAALLVVFLISLMVIAEGSHNPFLYSRF